MNAVEKILTWFKTLKSYYKILFSKSYFNFGEKAPKIDFFFQNSIVHTFLVSCSKFSISF